MNELKLLKANGLTTLGPALKYSFDLLNINRATSNVEGYGGVRIFVKKIKILYFTNLSFLGKISVLSRTGHDHMHNRWEKYYFIKWRLQ